MEIKMMAAKADEIQFTMTATMTLGEWKKIREEIKGSTWAGSEFSREIGTLIRKAEQHFSPAKD